MSRESQFVKNTFILGIGTIIPKFTSLITLPIVTEYLTKQDMGIYDLINTLISLLLPLVTLKVEMAVFRYIIEYKENKEIISKIITSAIIFEIIMVMSLLIALSIFVSDFSGTSFILICLYLLLEAILSVTLQIARGFSNNILYSIGSFVNSVVSMILIVITVKWGLLGLNGVLLSSCIAVAMCLVVMLLGINIKSYISIKYFSIQTLKELITYSWPLVPNSLSLWVMNLSDRLIISFFLGVEANAIYAVANKIPQLFTVVQGTVISAWQENASVYSKDDDVELYYSKMFNSILGITAGIMSGLIVITPIIFKLLIRGDYKEAYYQMPLLFLAMFFSSISSFVGGIYVAHKHTKSVGVTTIVAAIINFIINLFFIKKIGIYAASLSTLISYFFLACYRIIDVQKFQIIRIINRKNILIMFGLTIICAIFYINTLCSNTVNFIFGVSFAIFVNKDIIKIFFQIIKVRIKV